MALQENPQPASMAIGERTRKLVTYDDVQLEVIAEGSGPLMVILPSRGRDSDDNDEIAAGIAEHGFRVLRPQPRGIGKSKGPMENLTLRDFATDVAHVIRSEGNGAAFVLGHAFGNFVARMTASMYPELIRGVIIAAAASRNYPQELSENVNKISNLSLPDEERLIYLQKTFFAPGNDASVWLHGWYPEVSKCQRQATLATNKDEWWSCGTAPILDLQAANDPFRPPHTRNELKEALGERVTVEVISNASHALVPEQPQAVVRAVVSWAKKLLQG